MDQLARRIGRVKEIQLAPKLYYEGDYVCVRARVLVAKPLTRVTPLNVARKGRLMLRGKYKKVPYCCQVCGLMEHNHEECGDGVWEQKAKQFGSWMITQRKVVPDPQGGGRVPWGGCHQGARRDGTGRQDR